MDYSTAARYVTILSSSALRFLSYVFLRWIPGHPFPPLLSTIFLIYLPAFVYTFVHTSPYTILSDEVEIVTKPVDPIDAVADVDVTLALDSQEEELDVQQTVIVEEKDPEILKTLLTGLPSPSSLLWSGVTFAINILLVAMVFDLVYRATLLYPSYELSMARVGYVSETTARILVREPDASKYPVFASYRPTLSAISTPSSKSAWKSAGSISSLDATTDFTGTFTLKGLKPDTSYEYIASNHSGHFVTAPAIGSSQTFTFLHSSCLKNSLPYNPFAHPLSNRGLHHLSSALSTLSARFMLFLGDFIYIDVPRRHGYSAEDHRREYRQIYSSPDWPGASKNLPWIHVYDDHEIANDWDANTTGSFLAAFDPYTLYHTSVNPPAVRKTESYFTFTQGPATFFMLDTRRYRSPNDGTNGSDPITGQPTKTMLGATQLRDLLDWLARPEPAGVRWKIVVSSVPFTKNWFANAQDTWRGYLGERQVILEAMWDVGARRSSSGGGGIGVVILSGDRHEFAATSFPPPPDGIEEAVGLGLTGVGAKPLGNSRDDGFTPLTTRRKRWPASVTVHEFSASPLNMFYLPFRTYAESSTSADYVSDVCVKYIPDGNSKFGAVSLSASPTSEQSVLHYRLFVDGVERWSHTLTSPSGSEGGMREAIWG